jgi:hypothetical protein
MANRWGIPKDIEVFVKRRDSSCVYCGLLFNNLVFTHKTRPTWEHIINDIRINGHENIALCCGSCNASKGSKRLIDWLNSKYCFNKKITPFSVASVVKKHINSSVSWDEINRENPT